MVISPIIVFCILILVAYFFDLTSKFTKIPTVIFLLLIGWFAKQMAVFFDINMPVLQPMLPFLGSVGLALIVLEGGLELDLNKSKKKVLNATALSALIPIVVLVLIFGYAFSYYSGQSLIVGIINAIPLCVISSSIAIPSVQNLSKDKKEFIIYESSFSDIFGVVLFNFFVTNEVITFFEVSHFLLQIVLILIISLVASLGLAFLIKNINHHVKSIPIIIMVILIYEVSEIYHLPALIFILIFGLLLNNLDELKNINFIKKLEPHKLDMEVRRFRGIVTEFTFLVRTVFFILFGYVINTSELFDLDGLLIASSVIFSIILVRFIYFKIAKITPLTPLMFIAPRGLITILLFLSIPESKQITFINETLMLQIILISTIVMMFGLMFNKKKPNHEATTT